jgi:hypothetical protein
MDRFLTLNDDKNEQFRIIQTECLCHFFSIILSTVKGGAWGGVVVKALRY